MPDEPTFRYERFRFTFTVYPNRIEVEEKGTFSTKKEAVLLRNVTDVVRQGVQGKLRITTNDGRTREWLIGTRADEARDAILSLL